MDASSLDVMLFGNQPLESDQHDLLSDISDEELLFTPVESDSIFVDLEKASELILDTNGAQSDIIDGRVAWDMSAKRTTRALAHNRDWVIARIEGILEKIVDSLLQEDHSLTITLKSRAAYSRRRTTAFNSDSQSSEPKERDINFPGTSAQEAWNFTVLLRILELVHAGLVENTTTTKRDIYYRQPDLFVKQPVVDRYVDDLAFTLGITRAQLNVTTAAKGVVAGDFTLIRADGNQVSSMNSKEGMLVPIIGDNDALDLKLARWILIIEKEATFQSLLGSSQWEEVCLHGIVLTAKGYPDLNSRRFLRKIAAQAPHIPMFALMDLDPDGIAILSTYKYGSCRLAHEDVAHGVPALSLPNICWLGLKSHHLSRYPVDESDTSTKAPLDLQGLMKLTPRDRTRAVRMLEWDLCAEDGPEKGWRQELQRLLLLNVKAEMQILDELSGGLASWVRSELDGAVGQIRLQPINSACSDDGMLF